MMSELVLNIAKCEIYLTMTFDCKISKWVWSENTTITSFSQTHGSARKSHTTITRHQEDKLSKATSSLSLFPIKMIAKQPSIKNVREVHITSHIDWFYVYLALTLTMSFDCKVILTIWKINGIGNHCVKYEPPISKSVWVFATWHTKRI